MPKYRPDRHVFPPDGSKPEKKPRWEQLVAWEIVRCIATGKRPSPAYVTLHTPPKHVFGGGQWEGANLTALGTVAVALAGLIPPERVAEMYRSERLNGPGPSEGHSIGYGNYQIVAAAGGMELGGEAADESTRKLRRDLAWWMLWSTPDGKVIAPQGRAYSAEHPEHAQEIVRAILGMSSARSWAHQWWAGTWAYSAQLFAVEGSRLVEALFTLDEWRSFRTWRIDRVVTPEFAALLSELRAPESARWELRAWADGSHAGVVSGLRSYIDGPNGMIPAVVSDAGQEPVTVWTDRHTDGGFIAGGVEVVGRKWPVPLQQPDATVTLDDQGLTVNGERVTPVRDLPPLAPWEPSRAGVEGETTEVEPRGPEPKPEPLPEEEDPTPETPEPEEPMPEAPTIDPASITAGEIKALPAPVRRAIGHAMASYAYGQAEPERIRELFLERVEPEIVRQRVGKG